MKEFKCEHLVREGVCGAHLDVCCVHQCSYSTSPDARLESIKETYCNYPGVNPNDAYVKAIQDLSILLNGR